MKIKRIEKVDKEVITALQCDKCKKIYYDIFEIQEFLLINFVAGYGSVFGDGYKIQTEICQHCVKDLLGNIIRINKNANSNC